MRVLVIGGGIGGQALAAALRRRRINVDVFEKTATLRECGAALTLWPNGMRALRRLGIASYAQSAGWPIATSQIRRPDASVLSVTPISHVSDEAGAATIAIRRSDLHRLLLAAAGEDGTRLGKRCISIEQSKHAVTALMDDGEEISGDVLIGADGLWSRVRESIAGTARPREIGCLWRGITLLEDPSLRAGNAFETWGRGERFGMVQINAHEVYWYAGHHAWPDEPFELARTRLLGAFAHWHSPIRRAIERTPAAGAMRTVIYDRPPLREWIAGRVALLGDAAHPMTPDLGQGACTAIEDALELAGFLAAAHDPVEALACYAERRRRRCDRIAARSRRLSEMSQWNSRTLCAARNLVTRLTPAALVCRALLNIVDPTRV